MLAFLDNKKLFTVCVPKPFMKTDFRLLGTLLLSHFNVTHSGIGQEFKAKVPKFQANILTGRLSLQGCVSFPMEKGEGEDRQTFDKEGRGRKETLCPI